MTALERKSSFFFKRLSARVFLVSIVAGILVPALSLAGWLAISSADAQRAQLRQNALNQSREAAKAIDREILAAENVLSLLAGSHYLDERNFEKFYERASQASERLGAIVALFDRETNRQLINTALPLDGQFDAQTPLPRVEAENEISRSRKPTVSSVFFAPRIKQHVAAVVVPVFRDGNVPFSLSAGLPISRFAEILDSLSISPDHVVTIIDRNGTIVARSVKHAEFAGTRIANIPSEASSLVVGTNREGTPFHWYYQRSAATGWFVSVGVATSIVDGPSRRAWLSFLILAGVLLAGAIAVSYRWGGRLSQSIGALGIDRKPTREEFEVLFDSSPNGVLVIGADGSIILVNAQLQRTFGYDERELVGRPLELLVPERLRSRHLQFRREFFTSPQARPMGAGRELFGRRKDGSEFAIEIALTPIFVTADKLVLATIVDISARKLSEEKLSAAVVERDELRRKLMKAQEQERLRLARELHDQTGQTLTAALLELKIVESSVDDGSGAKLRKLREQMEDIGKTLHRVAWELRPASIDELGLAAALDTYISDWSEKYQIHAEFYCAGVQLDDFSDEIRTTLYRLVQEGLTNVAKHGKGASRISVVIERSPPGLRMMIEDDGCGFDYKGPAKGDTGERGLGIAGMRERLSLIGGELDIEAATGRGTTLFVKIPLGAGAVAA